MRDIFGVRVLLQLYARAPFRSILFFGGVWCLKSLTQRKRKRMMMNTRGLMTGGKTKFFSVFHFFYFFCRKVQKRRESLFEQNENIFFNFHVREKKKKWGKSIEIAKKKKKHCTAALTIIRECVCVCIHLI